MKPDTTKPRARSRNILGGRFSDQTRSVAIWPGAHRYRPTQRYRIAHTVITRRVPTNEYSSTCTLNTSQTRFIATHSGHSLVLSVTQPGCQFSVTYLTSAGLNNKPCTTCISEQLNMPESQTCSECPALWYQKWQAWLGWL